MSLCNKFGTPLRQKEDVFISLGSIVFDLKQQFVTHKEVEDKFLDKPEADRTYINEPITENLDMKNKRILNLTQTPEDQYEVTNKKYVDDLMKGIRNEYESTYAKKNELALPLKGTTVEKMLIYYNVAFTHKPRVWISAMFPYGLFPSLDKIEKYNIFEDIMKHKVIKGLIQADQVDSLSFKNAIYADNISLESGMFILNNNENIISKIVINIEFKKDYTFIFVAKKINPQDEGTIFTSTLPDRILGWRNSDAVFKVERFETTHLLKVEDTNLHCFIIRCNAIGKYDYWDFNTNIQNGSLTYLNENFGRVIIGGGKGCFSELILFDKFISNEALEDIKIFLKKFYNFSVSSPKPISIPIISKSILNNLA